MKQIKFISVVFIAALIFLETIGLQIIRDICLPCNSESVAVQIPFTEYESDCYDSCQTDKLCKHISNCNGCEHNHKQDHKHKKKVQVFSQNPEFIKLENILQIRFISVLLVVFDLQLNLLLSKIMAIECVYKESRINLPKCNLQVLLCTYII